MTGDGAPAFDTSVAHQARIYDYLLGGKDNYADDPHAIVATLMERLPPGSHLAISHIAADLIDRETQSGLDKLADQLIQQDFTFRDRERVARFFAGTDLVAPGLARVEEWRPEPGDPTGTSAVWGAVGRKR